MRFRRAEELRRLIDAGVPIDPAQLDWLLHYEKSAECKGFRDVFG